MPTRKTGEDERVAQGMRSEDVPSRLDRLMSQLGAGGKDLDKESFAKSSGRVIGADPENGN